MPSVMLKMETQCAQQPHKALETFQKWSQTILRPKQLAATFTPSQDLGEPYQTNRNARSDNEINGIQAKSSQLLGPRKATSSG